MSLKNEKFLIFNSDDFGHSSPFNMGIFYGIKKGVLDTSSVLVNMDGFFEAVDLYRDLSQINLAIHLDLIEGKSLTKSNVLSDINSSFNMSFIDILKKSYDKDFLFEVEKEFRAQIERGMSNFNINQINSHIHIHSIPKIFELTVKLAFEYKIKYIRTQYEKPYVSGFKKNFNKKFPINLIKRTLLNNFTLINRKNIPPEIITNDYLIGVTYTGYMDKYTILDGLKRIDSGIVEILIHPAYFKEKIFKKYNWEEFLITQDETILDEIKALGYKKFF